MRAARMSGLRFETRTRPVVDPLPRMDIAAFVGFAASGPVHRPVAVGDSTRFREIFGSDVPLAWDGATGRTHYAALGPCVESFFAQGGRRAWIVRVAETDRIVTHRFNMPGLVEGGPDGQPGGGLDMRARAPGSWCENLALGTRIARTVLPLRRLEEEGTGAEPNPVAIAPGGYRVDLVADGSELDPGELIELYFADDLPRLWLFASAITPRAGFLRVSGHGLSNLGPTTGAYWVQMQPDGTFQSVAEAAAIAMLDARGLRVALVAAALGTHGALVSARRIRLSLDVWRGQDRAARLENLGLSRDHPRFWARVPTDARLFPVPSDVAPPRMPAPLDAEITSPRFPLAGPQDDLAALARFTLPLGVGDSSSADNAAALPDVLPGTRLERDGLDRFEASLFLDPALLDLRSTVLSEAEHRFYVMGRELRGLHSLLPVDEVSMVALPDAVQPGWSRALQPPPDRLAAPDLALVPDPDHEGCLTPNWSAIEGAGTYRLERASDANFTAPIRVYEGPSAQPRLSVGIDCPARVFFRVRAMRDGETSPWSNHQTRILPPADFGDCAGLPPDALTLSLALSGSPPEDHLFWEPRPDASGIAADRYDVEIAGNSDFLGRTRHDSTETEMPLPDGAGQTRFVRVRGVRMGLPGPWSNTVVIVANARLDWALVPDTAYADATLIDIHRAALRFAAARANMICALSLPRHYRSGDVAQHLGRLTAGGGTPLTDAAGSNRVPPLSHDEAQKRSFGALFHPWVTTRTPDRNSAQQEITTDMPPDGAVLGALADIAVERGAWIAAANRPLERALGLVPRFDLDAWRDLTPLGVNILLRGPRGFALQSQTTLWPESAVGPIHVRRLMILLRRLALQVGAPSVFQNHDRRLRDYLRVRFQQALGVLYTRGAFDGATPDAAFTVTVDDTNNPDASVKRGRLIVTLQVAPAQAISTITIRLISDERGRLAIEET